MYKLNEEQVKMMIGREYIEGIFAEENSAFTKKAYAEIARVNEVLFNLIPYRVVFTEDDCYSSAKEMRKRVVEENVVYIYTGGSDHPFLTEEENWMGRAVHDVFAHMVCGCPFSFVGELSAYMEQRKYYPVWTWSVLFAEIPAQTAGFYYAGGFNFKQRAFPAPEKWLKITEPLQQDFSKNSVQSHLPYDIATKKLAIV